MKALSIIQPWASLCVIRWKSGRTCKMFETRSWATKYRGPLAIHASKGFPVKCRSLCFVEPFRSAMLEALDHVLPFGEIIGTVNLADCLPVEKALEHPLMTLTERQFGDYTPGRFAWLFEDAKPFETPIPAKGALGLWEWYEKEGA